jgi:hypothetical protein
MQMVCRIKGEIQVGSREKRKNVPRNILVFYCRDNLRINVITPGFVDFLGFEGNEAISITGIRTSPD